MAALSFRIRIVFVSAFLIFLLGFWAKLAGHDYHAYLPTRIRRPNGVIFILLAPSRITQALVALQNVEDRFNRRLKYPIVLFTAEDETEFITEEVKSKVNWITEGRASFATTTKESWEVPPWMDQDRVRNSMETIGFSFGYRAMCRYYSGFFWTHPALASYDWLWRLDTDIQFHCDVPYDPIERLIEKHAVYGFVQVNYDATWVQPSLASNVSQFLYENQHIIPPDANQRFVWKGDDGAAKAMAGAATSEDWTGACMYNNFEISHRSVWESNIYTKFFEHLDKAGGFFYERWGDSPIHSYGLAMSLRQDQVVQFKDLGYQHQAWAYECADLDRCACVKDGVSKDFNDHADAWFNPSH
ncbi:nucleotide-diphospho-sugar transferase [Crucibulum laeve]|uniref:Nucleotide-diphospho-sugar transferase n=1 Tax=Crucibulum laeve TaxID=68775 RepID=A0A5C3LTQ3_9AGAR|nr:nucleotide-diphospho-sugar transferase [Crucibulum laeve]